MDFQETQMLHPDLTYALAPSGAVPAPAPAPVAWDEFHLDECERHEGEPGRSERESDERYFRGRSL